MTGENNRAGMAVVMLTLAASGVILFTACDNHSEGSSVASPTPQSVDEMLAQNRKEQEQWRAQQQKTKQAMADGTYERPHDITTDALIGSPKLSRTLAEIKETATGVGRVTMANYQRLKTGMTYKQVVHVLGREGTELSRGGEDMGVPTVLYVWDADTGNGALQAMFQKGRLVQKSQLGLH